MKILVSIFLFSLCTAVLSDLAPDTNGTTTIAPEQNTTINTSPETTAVVTTEVSTSPTTDASNTTEVPTTTIAPPSPSPPSPTPTPSPITSTTPQPKPCSWNVTEKGVICIRVELQAKFIIPIEGKDHELQLGCDASTHKSDCSSNETQTLVLSEYDYDFTMIFAKEDGEIYVRNISLLYSLPEGKGEVANNSDNVFKVKAGNSYLCKSQFDVNLENVTMKVNHIHIQAFGEDSKDFGKDEECAQDDKVSDIVPIAVGVALGALIIIVLIAYLVGRRRSRQKGYQSV